MVTTFRRVGATVVAGVVAVLGTLLSPMQAQGATGDLQISSDGINYSSSYTGILFDDIDKLVPGDSQSETFFLRNSGTVAGYLRLVLSDVESSDNEFSEALNVSANTTDHPGIATAIAEASPCWVLSEGQTLAPGEVLEVETVLALANLDGLAGQGANASLSIRAVLSDSTPGTLPPTSCGGPGIEVPVVDPAPAAVPVPPVQPNTEVLQPSPPVDAPTADAGGDLPVLNLPGGIVIDPNTWNLREELLILLLAGSFLAGAAWFMIAARKRRHNTEDEAETTT